MMQERKPNSKHERQYIEQGSCCVYCNESVSYEDVTIDHFLPKKKGGKQVCNLVYSCHKCNGLKGHKSIEEFREVCFTKIAHILDSVANKQNWKMSEKQLIKFKRLVAILKSTQIIIKNGCKPLKLFN